MAVTIYDIAERAGMSYATVSMALRGLPKIKASTREKIRAIAEDMGYVPNRAAVALKTGYSNMVALNMPTLNAIAHRQFVDRLKNGCAREGWDIFIHELTTDIQEQRRTFEYIYRSDYLAVVTFLYDFATVGDILQNMLAAHRPVAVMGAPDDLVLHPGMLPLKIDNGTSVRCCVEKLISLGHRRIVHTSFFNTRSSISELISSILAEHGITDWQSDFYCASCDRLPDAEDGYRCARKLLEEHPGVTAVQCFNDQFAFGLMKGLQDLGVKVPDDISICGSDNTFIAKYNSIPISSIDMGQQTAADVICAFLKKQLTEKDWETPLEVRQVPGSFIMRETTGKAP